MFAPLRALAANAYMAAFTRNTRELASFNQHSANARRRIMADRLFSQIKYFGKRADALPEWREAAALPDSTSLWDIWPTLPIVTKDTLRSHFDASEMSARFSLGGRIGATGGSTGEPTVFLHDRAMVRAGRSLDLLSRQQMGWRPGMPTVAVWGSDRDIRPGGSTLRRVAKSVRGDFFVDGYHLTPQTARTTVELILRNAPVAVFGFSSMLDYVAQQVLEMGLEMPADAVAVAWSGGEMLLDQYVTRFCTAFGVPILNRYGGRELSTMACQYAGGAPLTVHRPWLMLEIVDDAGKPVGPGESGRLLWTSLICRGTPFLRYEIGDLGSYDANGIDESGIGALAELHGRQAGVLVINGKSINSLFWNHFLKDFPEVRRFQIVLTKAGSLRLRFNGTPLSVERETTLRGVLDRFIGQISVAIEWNEPLQLSAQGKLIQVVKE